VAVRNTDLTAIDNARERRRALILPREHGAWGLLLVPLITGAGVGFHKMWVLHACPEPCRGVSPPLRDVEVTFSSIVPFLSLLAAALALFWLRTPAESLLGTSAMRVQTNDERRAVVVAIAGLSAVALVALGTLLWAGRNPYLWLIGAAAAAAFIAQRLLKKLGRGTPSAPFLVPGAPFLARSLRRAQGRLLREKWGFSHGPNRALAQHSRMLSEIIGTIGLTSSAPAAYYVITGKFGATAWMLWLANLIFAGNQIHYVQLRIHTARVGGVRAKFTRGWTFAVGQLAMALVLVLACFRGFMPWLALIAFVPILFRGWFYFLQKPSPLVVRRLGWSELGQAVAFCVLFIAGFAFTHYNDSRRIIISPQCIRSPHDTSSRYHQLRGFAASRFFAVGAVRETRTIGIGCTPTRLPCVG